MVHLLLNRYLISKGLLTFEPRYSFLQIEVLPVGKIVFLAVIEL